MNEKFLTNKTNISFLNKLKECFENCSSFSLTVSFIKKAGLDLIKTVIEDALKRGVKGRIITSTYQNFTDIPSLEIFLKWMEEYPNFSCHLDYKCFDDNGFHSKGYIFEINNQFVFLVGSTNITRYALINNVEWNVLITKDLSHDLVEEVNNEFDALWNKTSLLDKKLITLYQVDLNYAIVKWDMDYNIDYKTKIFNPNQMQKTALKQLRNYRDMGINKSLIVAATASGKTFLAAFDAKNFDAKRLLFVVHRDTILEDARETFKKVFQSRRTYGIYNGDKKELDADFIFASNVTLSKHLNDFLPDEFDYIIFDECHHITASTYKKILEYFKPQFLLGLTATPERMDNQDVFEIFDKNVPYELRLRDAINNNLVVPFKYYGVRDTFSDYSSKEKSSALGNFFTDDHYDFISEQIKKYKPSNEKLKAVAFCKSVSHAERLALEFNKLGYTSIALSGHNDTGERIKAYQDLQDENESLEIIFTVDILNEGVDIPGINMVIFLRPTESSTIFIQQLGRGLRKFKDKEFLTVLDFIGNDYDRSVQIAFALGTLSSTTYIEKSLIKSLIRDDFKDLNINGVTINIDEISKEEILNYIEKTNFNRMVLLEQDYRNFKKYLMTQSYPSHCDYLNNDCAPNLLRFMKAKSGGQKLRSYYNFLKAIDEDVPLFTDEEVSLINTLSDSLPITRCEEFSIVLQILNGIDDTNNLQLTTKRMSKETILNAVENLEKQKVIVVNGDNISLNLTNQMSLGFKEFLLDLITYGLERNQIEFGDFVGKFKLYANYLKDQAYLEIAGIQFAFPKGTYHDLKNNETYVFVGIKKDVTSKENFNYKDKFLDPKKFQWESMNNTTKDNPEGKKLLASKKVYLFVRKMEIEDGIILPFTYFGTGTFTNCSESDNNGEKTLLFDIDLHNEVPEKYRFDFEVPEYPSSN